MDAAIRNLVRKRAGSRCEYCRLPQECYDLTFHVEHVVASQHEHEEQRGRSSLLKKKKKGTQLFAEELLATIGCSRTSEDATSPAPPPGGASEVWMEERRGR